MIFVGLAVGSITLLAAGFGVTMILGPRRRWNLLECVCLSWLFGTGTVSLLLWLGGMILSGVALRASVAGACVLLGFAGFRIARKSRERFSLTIPTGAWEWLLASVIAVEIAAMIFLSFRNALGWDGLLIWEIKARYAFLNDGAMPAAYYASRSLTFSHLEYPLFVPLTELWFYLWMEVAHQFWIKIIFPVFYAVGAILLAIISTRITGRRWIGGVVASLLFFIPYLTSGPGAAILGYVDFPLSVFYLAAIGYLISFLNDGQVSSFRFYAACLTLLPWVKREGAILWLVAAFCGAVIVWLRKMPRVAFIFLLPSIFILVTWQVYLRHLQTPAPLDFVPMTWGTMTAHLDRILPICSATLKEMMQITRWSLFWPLAAAAFVYLFLRARDSGLWVVCTAVFAPIVAYDFTYLFSTWPNYHLHISASFPRLLLQVMPVIWLAIALAMVPDAIGRRHARRRCS